MPTAKELLAEIRGMASGSPGIQKTAFDESSLDAMSPAQLELLAERLEKAGEAQEATARILEMRKAGQAPQATDTELRKMAYQQACRELGFKRGSISPVELLFGNMPEAQDRLAKEAADAAAILIGNTVQMVLGEGGYQ